MKAAHIARAIHFACVLDGLAGGNYTAVGKPFRLLEQLILHESWQACLVVMALLYVFLYSYPGWRIRVIGCPPPSLGHGRTCNVCSERGKSIVMISVGGEQQRSQRSAKLG